MTARGPRCADCGAQIGMAHSFACQIAGRDDVEPDYPDEVEADAGQYDHADDLEVRRIVGEL